MSDHRRKFLVVADQSEECRTALYFAAKRAQATDCGLVLLAVIEPSNFDHWIGVSETMRREAEEDATELLDTLAEDAEAVMGERPDLVLREDEKREALAKLIEEDDHISILVLGAAEAGEGPGPLVTALARGRGLTGARAIPVTVVPGGLSRDEIDQLT
ncbi:universal stress protein [Hyphobacterium sp.]|uniref:universal stress protein n=1 Tax=Hyphobacterium sp. TaxID=2004662 RepID=UPI003B52E5F2